MRSTEKELVKICLSGPHSDLLHRFSELLLNTHFEVELCDETDLSRADLICIPLTRRGIQTCKDIASDAFLLHISTLFVASNDVMTPLMIEAFDAGAMHIVTEPFSFDEMFLARFRSLVSLTRSRLGLVQMASTDFLTGLFSRRFLFDRLKRMFLNYESFGFRSMGCLMIDLDHLKAVNDSRGHCAGDLALVDLAKVIRSCVRSDDIVARIGGDEMAAILPNIELVELERIAERIRNRVETELSVVTTSIGISMTSFPSNCNRTNVGWFIDDLIMRADRALYEAKSAGRNRVVSAEN